jgi:uncharacterized protein YcgI (DUF1989 family)
MIKTTVSHAAGLLRYTNKLFEETIQPGASWSHVLKRGTALRITDLEGGANVGALFYNFECPTERYNMPDTLKAQHIARLTKDFVLYSDMGRILCSITGDTVGWHDPIAGCSEAGRDSFLIELEKWGLGPRDLVANINFFSRINVAADGGISYHTGNSPAGSSIELRAEMNVLAILNTCSHPLAQHGPRSVHLAIRKVAPPAENDPCRLSRPENGRGFVLTERYFV